MPLDLAHLSSGDGPPLLLLHGLGRNAADLRLLAERLQDTARVVSVDLRGHGRSPDARWTLEAACEDVAALIERLGLHRPAVVGHSLGGMIAALLAGDDRVVRAAVNLDGHGAGRARQYPGLSPEEVTGQLAREREAGLAMLPAGPLSAAEVDAAEDAIRAAAAAGHGDAAHLLGVLRRSLTADREYRPSRACAGEVLDAIEDLDLPAVYRRTKVPLLVVRATRVPGDELSTQQAAWLEAALTAVAHDQPLMRVARVDADHGLVGTAPDATADLVREFLAALPADVPGHTGRDG